jgi:hypothetical protein
MSVKHAAIFGAIFGGASGGLLAGGLAEYLAHDGHWLPLLAGTLLGAMFSGLFTARVTRNSLSGKSAHRH